MIQISQPERMKIVQSLVSDTFALRNLDHEIRTPLTAIVGHAELLLDDEFATSEQTRDSAGSILRAGIQLEKKFRALLDFSRIEGGVFGIKPKMLNMTQVVEREAFRFRAEAQRKNIRLQCQFTGPDFVVFDEYCFTQALANLVDNSVKFTERGKVVIRTYRDDHGQARLEIEDTGIGISPLYLSKLFEPFSQENSGMSRTYQGMGLGLALAHRYLALNGAELSVRSIKHAGSVFTIRLQNGI